MSVCHPWALRSCRHKLEGFASIHYTFHFPALASEVDIVVEDRPGIALESEEEEEDHHDAAGGEQEGHLHIAAQEDREVVGIVVAIAVDMVDCNSQRLRLAEPFSFRGCVAKRIYASK